MTLLSRKHGIPAYILIGEGFDELEVVYVLHKFRQVGLFIKSVSLFGQLVYSRQGIGLKADLRLCDRPFDPLAPCILILPSGGYNGDMLRHDARLKSLLETINIGEGYVAVTDSGLNLANDVQQVVTERPLFHPQPGQHLEEFISILADRITYADFGTNGSSHHN
jgi:putative intracellular protease/amidase